MKETHLKELTRRPIIFKAALKLFAGKGIQATTIRDIAREARVAEGTLYRHWRSKDELARELFCENMRHFKGVLAAEMQGAEGTREKLKRAIKTFYAFAQREPLSYRFLILTPHHELMRLVPKTPKPLDIFFSILTEGIRTGDIKRIDPPFACAFVIGAITKLYDFKRMGIVKKNPASYVDSVTDLLWEALKAG